MGPPRRLQAPAGNGEVLADPDFDRVPELVERNRKLLDRADVKIARRSLRDLRALARREVLELAQKYSQCPPVATGGSTTDAPLLLAGHQPELSHPGVWAKHFALNGLARKLGGIPLNIVVDNDTLRTPSLRFPVLRDHDPRSVHLESLPFDRLNGEDPYESRQVHDAECFRTVPERAAPLWQAWGVEPLLPRVWSDVVNDPASAIGGKFAAARRKWECEWGCDNLELPVSRLAATAAFARFAAHVAGDRFRACYNAALRAYRSANGITSRNHPASDLAADELPFWEWSTTTGRRGRLIEGRMFDPATVRPRALTLTLFARLCLGDFFVHGIGGGKYDEVTDAIIRDYFGLEPPAYQVLSATLHLPLPAFPATDADVARLERLERDLYWNPHRHLPDFGPAAREHDRLAASAPSDRSGRKERYRAFRRLGDDLRPRLAGRLAEVRHQLDRARHEAQANAILRRRDYSWVLFPEDVLKPFLQRFLDL